MLESHSIAQPVKAKVVEEGALFLRQERRVACVAAINGFLAPKAPVGVEGVQVHQERMRVGEMGAQAVQDPKTMCVNIAPIVHVDGAHPADIRQPFKSVAKPEHDDAFSTIGK